MVTLAKLDHDILSNIFRNSTYLEIINFTMLTRDTLKIYKNPHFWRVLLADIFHINYPRHDAREKFLSQCAINREEYYPGSEIYVPLYDIMHMPNPPYIDYFINVAMSTTIDLSTRSLVMSHACRLGRIEIVQNLLENKKEGEDADYINHVTSYVALVESARAGRLDIVQLVIKSGVEIYCPALCLAIEHDRSEIIDELIKCDLEEGSFGRERALKTAARYGRLSVGKMLMKDYTGNMRNIKESAACGGHLEFIKFLLETCDGDYDTIMKHAARHGHINIVEYMIANYEARHYNITMEAASEGGHLDIVKLMIEYGADNYRNCLERAVLCNSMDIVEYIIGCECDSRRTTDLINEALVYASEEGRLNIVQRMCELGARDIENAKNKAREHSHQQIVAYLNVASHL